jgi:transcriptional regulator with XRE-family HTH domain
VNPADAIRERRESLGLSQRTLARRAGTTQAAVSRIESGLTVPTWDTIRALMLAMGYEPSIEAQRLTGRFDRVHLADHTQRTPTERLELGMAANRLALRLREAARAARA